MLAYDVGAAAGRRTLEEEALCSVEELVLALGARDGVEAPHADNLLDNVARAVVGIRVCAQDAAEVRLQPQLVGRNALVAALVDAVALDGAGDVDLHAHIQAREGIVAAVQPRDDLVLLVVQRIGERVDVGGETGRRRGVDARDVVIDAALLGRRLDGLLYEVDEVGRAQFAQCLERLGAGLDGRMQLILVDPARSVFWRYVLCGHIGKSRDCQDRHEWWHGVKLGGAL
jgi:hypothetical protein